VSRAADNFRTLKKPILIVLFASVFCLAAWLRITNAAVISRSPDEKHYMAYAAAVLNAPLGAPQTLVATYNQNPLDWIYPIPLRVGYYYSIAAIASVFRITPEHAGVALSTASSILQLAMVTLLGLRFFNPWTTLAALALLSASPQDLLMARRVWGDGVSGCVAMVLVWLCAEIIMRPPSRLIPWFAGFFISGFYFLLLKESGGFFFGLCALGLAIHSWLQLRAWKPAASIIAATAATALCAFTLMAWLCGGVGGALDAVHHSAHAIPTNSFDISYQSGPWYSFPLGLWVLSPLTAFGCAVAMIALLLPGNPLAQALSLTREQRRITLGIAALIILIIITATLPPALKNIRLISFLFGPWYLMAGLGLTYIFARLRNLPGPRAVAPLTAIATLVVLYSCFSDYSRFQEFFIHHNIRDLNIRQLMDAPFAGGS
jgi:hypothetical protein